MVDLPTSHNFTSFCLIYFEDMFLSAYKFMVSSLQLVPLFYSVLYSTYSFCFKFYLIGIYEAFFLLVFPWYVSFHPNISTFSSSFVLSVYLLYMQIITQSIFHLLHFSCVLFHLSFKLSSSIMQPNGAQLCTTCELGRVRFKIQNS